MGHRRALGSLLALVVLTGLTACTSDDPPPTAPSAASAEHSDAADPDTADADEGSADPDEGSADPDGGADADGDGSGETATIRGALAWYYDQRAAPGTTIPAFAPLAARAAADRVPAYRDPAGTQTATAPAWSPVGPAPITTSDATFAGGQVASNHWGDVSGRISSLAAVPGSDQQVYAGSADGGIWKTSDGGATWAPVSDSLPSLAIGALAVSSDGQTIWAGTGEANGSSDAYGGAGLYVSANGGTTWSKRGGTVFDGQVVFKIVLSGATKLVATNHGLYRSVDNGKTWARVVAPAGGDSPFYDAVSDVAVVPGTGGTQVLAGAGYYFSGPGNGLWLSTDSGATFTRITPSGFPTGAGRISLAFGKNVVYALVGDGATSGFIGIFKSTGGAAGPWTQVAFSGDLDNGSGYVGCYGSVTPGGQAWYDQYVTVDPLNDNHVVVGMEEVNQSTDGGATWNVVGRYSDACTGTTLTPHPDHHAGIFAKVGRNLTFFDGNDGGVWKQSGATLTNNSWVNLNATLAITQPYGVAASGGPTPTYTLGTQDNGTVIGRSGAWPMAIGGDGGAVAIARTDPTRVYQEFPYMQLNTTGNGGQSWSALGTGDSGSSAGSRFIAPLEMDPVDSNHLVAGGRHVWERTTGATGSWTSVYDNGTGHLATALGLSGATIYEGWCGSCGSSAFVHGLATNQGGTWHSVAASGLPSRYISDVLVDPANDAHVWVTISGFSAHWIPSAGTGHVFESTDGGASFTDISANLPDAPANTLVRSRGQLVVGTDVGVYRRSSTGSWGRYGTGLPKVSVLDMKLVPGTSTIVVATHGRGAWTLSG